MKGKIMAIYRRCGRCGKRITAGSRCSCLKDRHKEYDRFSRDKKSKTFYSGKQWEHARAAALEADDGIDVYVFMTTGEIVPANDVHHIIPLKDDWNKRLDVNNLISLSHATHTEIEQMYKKNKKEIQNILTEMLRKYRRTGTGGI